MGKGPGGKHDSMKVYGPEEAALVLQLVEAHAPRWTHIAKLLSEVTGTERTSASVRNYYKRFCASKAIADRDSDIKKLNRCQICGMIKRGHICQREYVTPATAPPALTFGAVKPLAAESLLALSVGDEPVLPLASSALEVVVTPGTSPFSNLGGGPFSALSNLTGPLSAQLLASPMLASPSYFGVSPSALPAGFAFTRPPMATVQEAAVNAALPVCEAAEDEEEEVTDVEAHSSVCEESPPADELPLCEAQVATV